MGDHGDELVKRAKTRLGRVVDEKWRIDKLLGVGGMAAVYSATHRNGKRAAIKILHPEVAMNAGVKARFLREGYLANKVEHPGAVSILDDDEAPDGTVFLVMELLEGTTLENKCARGNKMACGDVLVFAEQVLDVLVAAHAKNIVHRDLKPGNLFLTTDGSVKVLDFGIARLREMEGSHLPSATTMSSMGTPGFMPPEQARGRWEQVDARADIWAVGATMFNMLTGRYVHEEATINEQLLAGMTKPAPAIRSVQDDVPKAAAAVIDKALAFDRAERWATAAEMQAAVREAYQIALGRSMSFSRRMLVVPRASLPDEHEAVGSAPTLASDDANDVARGPDTLDLKGRSSKPVAVTNGGATMKSMPPPAVRPERKGRGAIIAGAVIAVAAVLLLVATRGAKSSGDGSGPHASTSSSQGPAVAMPNDIPSSVASAASVASPELTLPPPVAPDAGAHVASTDATHAATHAHPGPTAKPAASAGAVDIFGRRR